MKRLRRKKRALYLKVIAASPEPGELERVDPPSICGVARRDRRADIHSEATRKRDGITPAVVFLHGGWVIGGLDPREVACRRLAREGELIASRQISPAVHDAIAATKWIAANSIQLGIDAERLSLDGASAGGNLAAVVALSRAGRQRCADCRTDLDRPRHGLFG